jgi:hypothetical protein
VSVALRGATLHSNREHGGRAATAPRPAHARRISTIMASQPPPAGSRGGSRLQDRLRFFAIRSPSPCTHSYFKETALALGGFR